MAIVLEVAGFWSVSQAYLEKSRGRVFFIASAFTYAIGAAFHAMFAPIGLTLQALRQQDYAAVVAAVRTAHEGLGTVAVLGIFFVSLFVLVDVARGKTGYPRWLAAVTPLPLIALMMIVVTLVPVARAVVLPCGINIANCIFLFAATIASTNQSARP